MQALQLNLNFTPPPELQTERLILKVATAADAPAILKLRGNETVMKYIDRPLAKTIEDAMDYLQKVKVRLDDREGLSWGVFLKTAPTELIGTMGLWRIDVPHFRAEIGYMLMPEYHRQGITNEAMKACIDYGFNVMQLHSIEAVINPHNVASETILKNNGFVQEAYFRENYYYNGQFLDSAVLSLIRPKN
jgi:[ribosomal protein S5]-alanine N-acetyltransferase